MSVAREDCVGKVEGGGADHQNRGAIFSIESVRQKPGPQICGASEVAVTNGNGGKIFGTNSTSSSESDVIGKVGSQNGE